jgi:hypothetical protein
MFGLAGRDWALWVRRGIRFIKIKLRSRFWFVAVIVVYVARPLILMEVSAYAHFLSNTLQATNKGQ